MKATLFVILVLFTAHMVKAQAQNENATKAPVPVSPEILKSYEGEYELRTDLIVKIFLEEGTLYLQAPREDRKVKLLPKNNTEFFNEINSAQVKFNVNEQDQVLSLTVINEVGRRMTAKKR